MKCVPEKVDLALAASDALYSQQRENSTHEDRAYVENNVREQKNFSVKSLKFRAVRGW